LSQIRAAVAAAATLFFLGVGAAAQQLPPAPGPIPAVRRGTDGRIELAPPSREPAAIAGPLKRQPETRSAPTAAAPPASTDSAGCGAKRISEIMVATLNGVPFVTPLANGVPINLLLDTGAERTILTHAAAQRTGAQPPGIECRKTRFSTASAQTGNST